MIRYELHYLLTAIVASIAATIAVVFGASILAIMFLAIVGVAATMSLHARRHSVFLHDRTFVLNALLHLPDTADLEELRRWTDFHETIFSGVLTMSHDPLLLQFERSFMTLCRREQGASKESIEIAVRELHALRINLLQSLDKVESKY